MKKRLDILIVEKGLITGRDRAKSIIMAGQVYVNNQKADKPGQPVDETDNIEVRGDTLQYVSRGGLKLEKSMQEFSLTLDGLTCADIGASTGGFTDCMLQNGAVRVYAVDVGYGQLAWKLRTDPRVINLERTNIRYVTEEQIPEPIDFISIDVSFISLGLVLPVAYKLLGDNCKVVCLVKPQFEAGREFVGKKGVVRELSTHLMVLEKVLKIADNLGLRALGLTFSPVKGPEGNIEYLLYLQKQPGDALVTLEDAKRVAESSHLNLDK
ncbi:MAG: TlyA family RNA methyltransferase [Angelakisella sp.]